MRVMRNMTRGMLGLFLALAIMIAVANAQSQSTNSPQDGLNTSYAISSLDNESTKIQTMKIIGTDATAFPKIKVNIFINKFCALAGSLKKETFSVKEDDNAISINNLYFTGNATGQQLDLAVVFDDTTSMDNELKALKAKVKDLTQKINSSNIDAKYSLVTFNGTNVRTEINWTKDSESLKRIINKIFVSGGNLNLPENSLDGIEKILSFGFRPTARKIILVVTDEPSLQKGDGKSKSNYTLEDVKQDLMDSGVTLIAISPDFSNSRLIRIYPIRIFQNMQI